MHLPILTLFFRPALVGQILCFDFSVEISNFQTLSVPGARSQKLKTNTLENLSVHIYDVSLTSGHMAQTPINKIEQGTLHMG